MLTIVKAPKLKRDWKGKKIRLIKPINSQQYRVPAGAIGTITIQSPKGSRLEFKSCPHCGVEPIIIHVGAENFEFIEET